MPFAEMWVSPQQPAWYAGGAEVADAVARFSPVDDLGLADIGQQRFERAVVGLGDHLAGRAGAGPVHLAGGEQFRRNEQFHHRRRPEVAVVGPCAGERPSVRSSTSIPAGTPCDDAEELAARTPTATGSTCGRPEPAATATAVTPVPPLVR